MTTRPGAHTFTLLQGATFSELLTWKDSGGIAVDLTGYTARMKARQRKPGATAVIDLTTANGGIALGGSAGTIALTLSATATAALAAEVLDYDLELVSPGGVVTRLLQGVVAVQAEVTA